MKNRIDQLFSVKKINILNVYCTAGFPKLHSTMEVMEALQQSGADMIELGIPYSDPIADGPVIQQSNMQALQNGMSIPVLFEQLKEMRDKIKVPVILMGYLNPVLQYGMEKFCTAAASAGIDGIILPDLPIHEFETEYQEHFKKHGLKFIFLVTPETTAARVLQIDKLSGGFIYAVSASSTTGSDAAINEAEQQAYFRKLQDMHLVNPVLAGFGIKDKKTFNAACTFTRGAIIGSAYIHAIRDTADIGQCTKDFIINVKG